MKILNEIDPITLKPISEYANGHIMPDKFGYELTVPVERVIDSNFGGKYDNSIYEYANNIKGQYSQSKLFSDGLSISSKIKFSNGVKHVE